MFNTYGMALAMIILYCSVLWGDVGSAKTHTFSSSPTAPSRGTSKVGTFGPRTPGTTLPKWFLYSVAFMRMVGRVILRRVAVYLVTTDGR